VSLPSFSAAAALDLSAIALFAGGNEICTLSSCLVLMQRTIIPPGTPGASFIACPTLHASWGLAHTKYAHASTEQCVCLMTDVSTCDTAYRSLNRPPGVAPLSPDGTRSHVLTALLRPADTRYALPANNCGLSGCSHLLHCQETQPSPPLPTPAPNCTYSSVPPPAVIEASGPKRRRPLGQGPRPPAPPLELAPVCTGPCPDPYCPGLNAYPSQTRSPPRRTL
jgi:hypothetical protein